MQPWMRILPKSVRHLFICRWKYGWHSYCVGHGRNLETRYGLSTLYDGWQTVPKRPRPWTRVVPKSLHHLVVCRWRGKYQDHCVGHGQERIQYLESKSRLS